jgi:hypothetical protein
MDQNGSQALSSHGSTPLPDSGSTAEQVSQRVRPVIGSSLGPSSLPLMVSSQG